MIPLSTRFDLGRDTTRIKDRRDGERQAKTASVLLQRLFHDDPDQRWELQLLADEVGMGKTFVALAVAFSMLDAMRNGDKRDDLRGCCRKVVIVTPSNGALQKKWLREVGEFVKRCVAPEQQAEVQRWFASADAKWLDDLAAALRAPGGPCVIVTSTSVFGDGKGSGRLLHRDLKQRFMLAVLFRHWGNRFPWAARERLLRGAPPDWPSDPRELRRLTEDEAAKLTLDEDEALAALERWVAEDGGPVEKLLQRCKAIAEPYARNRAEQFDELRKQIAHAYRETIIRSFGKDVPLVIVDEAHNWKNGPTAGTNGYRRFAQVLGRRTRRMLLLTATPFQLRPDEIRQLLRISDDMKVDRRPESAEARRSRLAHHRDEVLQRLLAEATAASLAFQRAWATLHGRVSTEELETFWRDAEVAKAREDLRKIALAHGCSEPRALDRVIDPVVARLHPDLRVFAREALRLFAWNADLSVELGRMVVRHRRRTEHRLVRVGNEYVRPAAEVATRPDRQVLHAAQGLDVRGDGELPHYLLMRAVAELQAEKGGRASLGSALTGCYSTLLESAEGKMVVSRLGRTARGKLYLDLLSRLVSRDADATHPKMQAVIDQVVAAWHAGEKSLIFCFRMNTAKRLASLIEQRIQADLQRRVDEVLGGAKALEDLRDQLSNRRKLCSVALDRVLLSARLAHPEGAPTVEELELQGGDWSALAELSLRYDVDIAERPDRVFLFRAIEHVLARRLRGRTPFWRSLLERMAQASWVEAPYGGLDSQAEEDAEGISFDERGSHHRYEPKDEPSRAEIEPLGAALVRSWQHARRGHQRSRYDLYLHGPSLWFGVDPASAVAETPTVGPFHRNLWAVCSGSDGIDWKARRLAMMALRRVALREAVLLRLLDRQAREEGVAEMLVEKLFARLPGQQESMADRLVVFLEDLRAAHGDLADPNTTRGALFDATRLKGNRLVALVTGETDAQTRARVFSGFNTPLLPEVLVCTSVGQEGIDLHRHCRHVVHYDLAWNPAVLEQRTGRVDRIGSKTFREREREANLFLEVGVPFLAGTYDERMYEELRLRAQIFEVLTGGDVSPGHPEGSDEDHGAEDEELGLRLVELPAGMVKDLRVNLHVWSD